MSFDQSQFKQVYIEESLENVELMERELLSFDLNNISLETVNTIFRAAHSIKGGAATFDFLDIAHFTHEVETLLDELRSEKRQLSEPIINCLLRAVDCIKMMIETNVNGQELDKTSVHECLKEVKTILSSELLATKSESQNIENQKISTSSSGLWEIHFVPNASLLCTGNEPLRIFRELSELGELSVTVNIENVPNIHAIEPENCYLDWYLRLSTSVDIELSNLQEIFDWVIDDCKLDIKPVQKIELIDEVEPEPEPENKNSPSLHSIELKTSKNKNTSSSVKKNNSEQPDKKMINNVSIRVDIDKVDTLINLVGELVITQSMLSELGNNFDMSKLDNLQNGLGQLLQNTKELQESVMRIRMLPISNAFNRFPRMIRDLAMQLGKKIHLQVSGEQTELDKTLMEKITDPLVHLVRNSIDHGIETSEERVLKGKSDAGNIKLNAYHEGGNIVIEVIDDGAGLNREKILQIAVERGVVTENTELTNNEVDNLIFEPGFSTAETITDVSGRGVGMDVVKKNITRLGGSIEIDTVPNEGTTFRIRLPLTLAIVDGQLIRVGEETYVIPLIAIIESLQIKENLIRKVAGGVEFYRLRNENVPILRIYKEFNILTANQQLNNSMLVVVEGNGMKVGLLVDELLAQQQVVIKSLETNYGKVEGVSGATILGDGKVALIIDVPDIIRKATRKRHHLQAGKVA